MSNCCFLSEIWARIASMTVLTDYTESATPSNIYNTVKSKREYIFF